MPEHLLDNDAETKDSNQYKSKHQSLNNTTNIHNNQQNKQQKRQKSISDNTSLTQVLQELTEKNRIPDEQYYHDPLISDVYGKTVAMYLSHYGIIPPEEWMHDIDLQDNYGNSIRSNLLKHNYIYLNGQFVYNAQSKIKQKQCAVCLKNEKQEFLNTNCGHNICVQCFKRLVKLKKQFVCPKCKHQNWIMPIDEKQYQEYMKQFKYRKQGLSK